MAIEISEARLCGECEMVTAKDDCPLCEIPTREHPGRDFEDCYCIDCGGEFEPKDLVVLPWEENPYDQCDDGMLITICRSCSDESEADD